MMRKAVVALAVLWCTSFHSSSCHAAMTTDDGFKVEVNFKEKSDGLHVFGKVDGGRECKQLNLTIFLANSRFTGLFKVATFFPNYDGGWPGPGKYKEVLDFPAKTKSGKVHVDFTEEAKLGKWNVDHVETHCLN